MYCICLTQVTIEYEFPLILICSDYLVSYATLQHIFLYIFLLSIPYTTLMYVVVCTIMDCCKESTPITISTAACFKFDE